MAYVRVPDLLYPNHAVFGNSAASGIMSHSSTLALSAAGFAAHMTGIVRWADASTSAKTLSKIHFRIPSAATGTGTLIVGIQTTDTAVNPPHGDGTFDRSGTLDITTLSASGRYSATMSAGAGTLANFDKVSVVIEADTGFAGSVVISGITSSGGGPSVNTAPVTIYNTSSYNSELEIANVLLEASDGTFGCLGLAGFSGDVGVLAIDVGGETYAEGGLAFQLPFTAKARGLAGVYRPVSSGGTADFRLYSLSGGPTGTPTQLASLTNSDFPNSVSNTTVLKPFYVPLPSELTLTVGTWYGVTVRATSSSNLEVMTMDIPAGASEALPSGECVHIYRASADGTFTSADTVVCPMSVVLSALDDGAGGGGGLSAINRSVGLIYN